MKKRTVAMIMLFAVFAFIFVGCMANIHVIGQGAKGNTTISKTQWYALGGLIQLNKVDTNAMAGSVQNYTITTEMGVKDFFISAILGSLTITSRTVIVNK